MEPLIVDSHALYELMIQPHFQDLVPEFNGSYSGALNEFTLMDEVSLSRGTPIMDITPQGNFLKRKDKGCKTDWSKVASTSDRRIHVDKLYGAVEDCEDEFYQGCLQDFYDQAPKFRDIVLSIFKKGMGLDLAVNSYFGDVGRAAEDTGKWNWNTFDGVFTKIANYVADSTIPASQVLGALVSGAVSPSVAYGYFQSAFDKRSPMMRAMSSTEQGYYVNYDLAIGLWRYYKSLGIEQERTIDIYQQGIPALRFEGIPVYVEPLWDTILKMLNGGTTAAHALVLTLRGNWIFGTNKDYGGGKDRKQALRVWWSEDDEVWRRKMHLTAGTEIAVPEHTVFGVTNVL